MNPRWSTWGRRLALAPWWLLQGLWQQRVGLAFLVLVGMFILNEQAAKRQLSEFNRVFQHFRDSQEAKITPVPTYVQVNNPPPAPILPPVSNPGAIGPENSSLAIGQPVRTRAVPYPFHSYLSVLSDPDSQSAIDYPTIHRIIHDQFHLNISDQVFISGHQALPQAPVDLHFKPTGVEPRDWETFYNFLVYYNRGWVESIHGWHFSAFSTELENVELAVDDSRYSRTIPIEHANYSPEDQYVIVFEYQTSSPDTLWRFTSAGSELPRHDTPPVPLRQAVDRAWRPGYAFLPKGQQRPAIGVHIDGPENATLSVRNLAVTNLPRARVLAEADYLRRHNIHFLTYTEHGKLRDEHAVGTRPGVNPLMRRQFLADDPIGAPNTYFIDVLEQVGVTFINPYARTAALLQAKPPTEIVRPMVFHDSTTRYGLDRFFCYPRKGDDWPSLQVYHNMSFEPWLGFLMEKARVRAVAPGEGGVIYTHWGYENPEDQGVLSEETLKQLGLLADAYYNFSGQRRPHERVWVAPASEVALLARANLGISQHAVYEPASNTITLRPWVDPVSQQAIPAPQSRAYGLGNATFYVRDATDTRLLIGNYEYTALMRNPPDDTGQESVTIVDDSRPTVVFDEIDLYHRFASCRTEQAETFFRTRGGFQSAHCLELKATGADAAATWQFPELSSEGHSHFRFAYRKQNPQSRVGIELKLKDGTILVAREGEHDEPGWSLPLRRDTRWHDVVVSFATVEGRGKLTAGPLGAIESIRFTNQGATGDQTYFDCVQFLHQPIHPLPPEGYLVAGRTDPPLDGVPVVLEDGSRVLKTVTKGGIFLFEEKIPRGALVRVYAVPEDGAKRWPKSGRTHDIRKNEVELSIDLRDIREADVDTGLTRVDTGLSEVHPEGGLRLKPKSLFTNSGLAGAVKQEWCNTLEVNNLGFLDKDRRAENLDGHRRVLILGHCIPFGHSMPKSRHMNLVMEDLFRHRLGYDVEVPILAQPSVMFGKYWPYYRAFGKALKPDVTCILMMGGIEVLEADPDLLAKFYEYDPRHLPQHMFRSKPDGSLEPIEPDPEYFNHVGQDPELAQRREEEKKKGYYYMDGVDWMTLLHRTDDLPPVAEKALAHFERVLTHYRDEFERNGSKLMLVQTAELPVLNFVQEEWTDAEGHTYRRDKSQERLRDMCRKLGIGFVDVAGHLETNCKQPKMCGWKYDTHPSPYGMEWMADAITGYLIETKFLEDVPYNDLRGREDLAGRSKALNAK